MKALSIKQPSHDFHKQHHEVIQVPIIQNEFPSTDAIVLQRMSACPCDGGCPRCEGDMVIQPKLKIGEPGDRYEREADRVADEVMRMSEPQVQRQPEEEEFIQTKPLAEQITSLVPRKAEKEGEEEPIQTKHAGGQSTEVGARLQDQIRSLRGRGRPLSPSVRNIFEPRFGYDFSQVRVHTDTQATETTRALNALAYTVEQDIVFGAGQYDPATLMGRELIAHELSHVVQQREGTIPPGQLILRQHCSLGTWDGTRANCYASAGRWIPEETTSTEITPSSYPLDQLVINQGLREVDGGGTWVTEVYTPPNFDKNCRQAHEQRLQRGRVDGLKVIEEGRTLRVEVVEVKSRATDICGGCNLASTEARGYVSVLNRISRAVADISRNLVSVTDGRGFRMDTGRATNPNQSQREILEQAGVDLDNPQSRRAWVFYNSLQNKLNRTFRTSFDQMDVDVYRGHVVGTTYDTTVPPQLIYCRRGGRTFPGTVQLQFQVNGAGGVSYGCLVTCEEEEEETEREPRHQEQPREVEVPLRITDLDSHFHQIQPQLQDEIRRLVVPVPGIPYTIIAQPNFVEVFGQRSMEQTTRLLHVPTPSPIAFRTIPYAIAGFGALMMEIAIVGIVTLVAAPALIAALANLLGVGTGTIVVAPTVAVAAPPAAVAAAAPAVAVAVAAAPPAAVAAAAPAVAVAPAATAIGAGMVGVLIMIGISREASGQQGQVSYEFVRAVPQTEIQPSGAQLGTRVTFRDQDYLVIGRAITR